MSTLEEPKGEEPEEAPHDDEPAGQPAEPGAADETDESVGAEPAEGAEDTAGSTLERGEGPLEADEITVDPARVRRAPRFGRFVLLGFVLGILVAMIQTWAASPESIAEAGGPWAPNAWGFFWLMSAIFVPLAVLLMCGVALLLDRRSRRGK